MPVLLTEKGCGYRRVFERALHSAGARPAIAGEFISGETVKCCVEAGTMIGVLAHISVASELGAGRLIALPWNGPPLTLSSYLVAHRAAFDLACLRRPPRSNPPVLCEVRHSRG